MCIYCLFFTDTVDQFKGHILFMSQPEWKGRKGEMKKGKDRKRKQKMQEEGEDGWTGWMD